MGGKAKMQTHTAASLAKKAKEAQTNKGGGAAGAADRKGGAAGKKTRCFSIFHNRRGKRF